MIDSTSVAGNVMRMCWVLNPRRGLNELEFSRVDPCYETVSLPTAKIRKS